VSPNQISTKKRAIQLVCGKKLREAYLNQLNINYTIDTLSVLVYLDSNNYDGSVSVTTCENVLINLKKELKFQFPINDIDSVIIEHLRVLYLKTSCCKFVAGCKYWGAIIKLKLF
jgi:hypothetical protein